MNNTAMMHQASVWYRRLAAMMGSFLLTSSLVIPSNAFADPSDLSAVAEIYAKQNASLTSLYVKYSYSARLLGKASDVRQYLGTHFLTHEARVFAFKGDRRYFSSELSESLADKSTEREDIAEKGPDGMPKKRTLAANFVCAYDGETLVRRGAGGMTASIIDVSSVEDDVHYFSPDYMGLVLRVLPDAFNRKNDRAKNRLPDAIERGYCRARRDREVVDGASCVVIEVDDTMVLWCDPELGYSVRRQEGYYPQTTLPLWRATCSDFVEVCKGVWLPRKAVDERFAGPDAPTGLRNVPILAYDYAVLEMFANEVPDELFELRIPPGTLVLDYARGKKDEHGETEANAFYMPAGQDELDGTIGSFLGPRSGSRRILYGTTLLVAVVMAILLLGRHRRMWRQSGH